MNTPAEKALLALDTLYHEIDCTPMVRDLGGWVLDNEEALRRALKIAAAVDGDGLVINVPHHEKYIQGNNDLLERLRGIK